MAVTAEKSADRLGGAGALLHRGPSELPLAEDLNKNQEVVMSTTVGTATEIRPFQLEIPDEQLVDLLRRIGATRWPSRELVDDRSQGVQLATMKELARYWSDRLRLT